MTALENPSGKGSNSNAIPTVLGMMGNEVMGRNFKFLPSVGLAETMLVPMKKFQ